MIHKKWKCRLCKTIGWGNEELKKHFGLYHKQFIMEHKEKEEDDDNDLGFVLGLGAVFTDDEPFNMTEPEPVSGHGGEFSGAGSNGEWESHTESSDSDSKDDSNNNDSNNNDSNDNDSNDSNDSESEN